MKSAVLAATVLAIGAYAQADVKINTPTSLVVCQPIKLSWSGGTPPYYVSAIPGGQASAAPLKDFGKVDGTELTWIVDLEAGTSISMQVKDSTGSVNYAQAVNVQAGSDTACLTAGDANVSGTAAGGASASPAAGSPAAGSASPAAASGSAAASSAASKPASAAASGASAAASGASSAAAAGSSAAASAAAGTSSAGRIAASTGLVGAAALFLAAFL